MFSSLLLLFLCFYHYCFVFIVIVIVIVVLHVEPHVFREIKNIFLVEMKINCSSGHQQNKKKT